MFVFYHAEQLWTPVLLWAPVFGTNRVPFLMDRHFSLASSASVTIARYRSLSHLFHSRRLLPLLRNLLRTHCRALTRDVLLLRLRDFATTEIQALTNFHVASSGFRIYSEFAIRCNRYQILILSDRALCSLWSGRSALYCCRHDIPAIGTLAPVSLLVRIFRLSRLPQVILIGSV